MHSFPHLYTVSAQGQSEGVVTVSSAGLPDLTTTAPPEFDGPSGYWSPETLLTSAVADCFILTFRSVAKASNLPFEDVQCSVVGVLDRVERVTKFTEMQLTVTLKLPAGGDAEKAQRALEKSEHACLITNSLSAKVVLTTNIS